MSTASRLRVIDLLGVRVGVTVAAGDLAASVDRALAGLPSASEGPADHEVRLAGPDLAGRFELVDGTRRVASDIAQELAVAWLLWYLNRLAATTPHHVTVHAGAVVGAHGAVLLPGPPGAGKSTMTAALVRAGFGYLSDELAALDLTGARVHPFPRPLSLHPTTVALLGPGLDLLAVDAARPGPDGGVVATPEALRGGGRAPPSPPAAVVMPRIRPGAPARLAPLEPADALLTLLAHAPNLELLGPVAFRALAQLVGRCPAWVLEFDALEPAAAAVAALGPPPPEGVDTVRFLPVDDQDAAGPRRAPGLLAVRFGGGDIVVYDQATGTTHRLNGPAAEVYERCDGRALATIGAELTDRYADPEVSRDVVAVLDRLQELGLVVAKTPA